MNAALRGGSPLGFLGRTPDLMEGHINKAAAAENPAARTPLISILIVNFNGAGLLKDCLDSLMQLSYRAREVVVVDNASTDGSLEVLKGYPWVKVVRSATNRGFAGGNNLGLEHCAGDCVLLLNSDTIAPPSLLESLESYLRCHPEVGVVQGKMVLPRFGNVLDVCGSFFTAIGLPYHYGFYKPDGPLYNRSFPVFSGKGACLMFRRDIVAKVGGFLFEEDFFCYYEETDFCHRAWLSGTEVHFVASPVVQHLMGATAGGPQSAFVLKHYLRNMSFSVHSNLSAPWRFRVLPAFYLVLMAGLLISVLKRNSAQSGAYWGALKCGFVDAKKIRARRRTVARIRRLTDRQIFNKVLRTPRVDYFFKTLTNELSKYRDMPV